ncbi:MAG TPA: OmpA family protein [Hyphomicrobiaceae bacterium]|nr:OmpA family protein [Hyphomicrobiaceae bacterium]
MPLNRSVVLSVLCCLPAIPQAANAADKNHRQLLIQLAQAQPQPADTREAERRRRAGEGRQGRPEGRSGGAPAGRPTTAAPSGRTAPPAQPAPPRAAATQPVPPRPASPPAAAQTIPRPPRQPPQPQTAQPAQPRPAPVPAPALTRVAPPPAPSAGASIGQIIGGGAATRRGAAPVPPPAAPPTQPPPARTAIGQSGQRVIIRDNNRVIIRHDERARFHRPGQNVRNERRRDGTTVSIIERRDGVQIISVLDARGNLIERRRRGRDGSDFRLIDNRRVFGTGAKIALGVGVAALTIALAAPVIAMPRHKYIVDYRRASEEDVYEALYAPPVERFAKRYSLEEVRQSYSLRERLRSVDLDAITFASGSWEVPRDQHEKLRVLANAMLRILRRSPDEIFMIEGHTDSTGTDEENLALSDRRAESVAVILTDVFGVPPENLVTQGYGEQYLKIQTAAAEPLNRRVSVRRITPVLARNDR